MPLSAAVVGTISNIIINIISNDLDYIKGNLILYIKIKLYKRKTKKWIEEFIKQNDETFLTNSTFERFLKYHQPIEKIHDYVFELSSSDLDKNAFIAECVKECKEHFTINKKEFLPKDERLLKEFYNKTLNCFVDFSNKQLSIADKRIIQENKRGFKQINDKLEVNINSVEDIKRFFTNKQQITNPDVLHNIYNYVNKEIWNGEFEKTCNLLPLLEGKSNDLENSIKIKVHLLSTYKCLCQDIVSVFSSINDSYLHNDIARLLILQYFEDYDTLSKIKAYIEDENLSDIIECILNGNTDKFFKVEVRQENNANICEIHFVNYYKNEQWLANRVCLLFLNKQTMINSNIIVKQLIGDNKTFIDDLIFIRKDLDNIMFALRDTETSKQNKISEIIKRLSQHKSKIEKYSEKIQLLYYDILGDVLVLGDYNNSIYIPQNIPYSIHGNPRIKAINAYIKCIDGEIDEQQLIDCCLKTEEYWALNCYLAKKFNDDPNSYISFMEKQPSIIKSHPMFFFNYYNAIKYAKGNKVARELLSEYESVYSNHLEYWIELYATTVEDKSILLDTIHQKWKNDEFSLLNLYTEFDFVNVLVAEKHYNQALEVVAKLETLGLSSPELLRVKANILINLNRSLDAFQILLSAFEHYRKDMFVIGKILEIAINYKRDVPQKILDCATQMEDSNILTMVAIIYEKHNRLDDATQLAIKSLLLSRNEHDLIYGYYFSLSEKVPSNTSQKLSFTNDDTAIILQRDRTSKTYCVHKDNTLFDEGITRHNAIHIHRDTAIQMGLFRKEVNTKVNIDEVEYSIIEILPLNTFLFRVCLNVLIDNGSVKQISVRTDSKGSELIEEITEQFKEYFSSDESLNEWLFQYNDMSKLPLTLFALSKSTKLTYQEFVFAFLYNKAFYIREFIPLKYEENEQFILSFAALTTLYKLGVPIETLLNKDVLISTSTMQEIIDANKKIIKDNNKDNVSSMGIAENKLYLHSATEEEKVFHMQEAAKFKNYAQQIKTEENKNDISFPDHTNEDLIELFGICDYDSISIAKNSNRILVHPEPIVSYLSNCDEYNFSTSVTIDFLTELDISLNDLLEYMNKLVEFRFIITLTVKSFNHIIRKYDGIKDEEIKESLLEKWINYLSSIKEIDGDYKIHFINNLTEVLKEIERTPSKIKHPLYYYLFMHYLKYNNLKLNFNKDANGNMEVRILSADDANK